MPITKQFEFTQLLLDAVNHCSIILSSPTASTILCSTLSGGLGEVSLVCQSVPINFYKVVAYKRAQIHRLKPIQELIQGDGMKTVHWCLEWQSFVELAIF